jgi:type II secretory pathway pseudopilin PulG
MKVSLNGFKGGFARQGGFTLLESIIVGLVFIAIVAGVLQGKSLWDTRNDINNFSSAVQTVAETAKATYGGASYGTGTMNFTLNTNRAFSHPRYRVAVSGGVATVTNQFNAAVAVGGATTNFTYSETGLPDAVCAGVAPRLQPTMWSTITIGAAAARPIPISAAQAGTDCAALAGGAVVLTSNG